MAAALRFRALASAAAITLGGTKVGVLPGPGSSPARAQTAPPPVTIGTPTTSSLGDAFLSTARSADAQQVSIIQRSALAATRYAFTISDGAGSVLTATDDGGADVVDAHGLAIAHVEAPWAHDAAGTAIPTSYEVSGSTLTQVVGTIPDEQYPAIADPKVTTGWVTGTVYFDRADTHVVATSELGGAVCGTLYWNPPAMAACGVSMAVIWLEAKRADARAMCLKFKFTLGPPWIAWPDIYRGGYCGK